MDFNFTEDLLGFSKNNALDYLASSSSDSFKGWSFDKFFKGIQIRRIVKSLS